MQLSIIIVSYNVRYFLEQCLCSVRQATREIQTEVFVVDNCSRDDSIAYLQPRFPFVQFLENEDNLGFSAANNRALAMACGKYILFLNPDTLLAEDSLADCIAFMKANPQTGALGVRMIDGTGNYLRESKRGFPGAWASFCKLSGLTALFPRSALFARYYLGHLSEIENQVIDVISGAFFFARKQVLERTGGFDEQFFMYAEDIDLSRRIQLAGYQNCYLSSTTILHFKGESTQKDQRYVRHFYKAMSQFSKKYLSKRSGGLFTKFMDLSIRSRACLAAIGHFFASWRQPRKPASSFILSGDMDTAARLASLLEAQKKTVARSPEMADALIYCQGEHYSFKEILISLEQRTVSGDRRVHARHSGSVVASASRESPGSVLALYP